MTKSNKYTASFTAGALLFEETIRVLPFILNDDLDLKKDEIIKQNKVQINSEAARKRVLHEIKKRAKAVDKSIWELFDKSNKNEKRIVLFYVTLKTYQLLYDFMREVIWEKWKSLGDEFSELDIEIFLNKKSATHSEIERWTESTKAKVIQVLTRIIREAGILNVNKIIPLEAPNYFWNYFVNIGDPWFLELALLNKTQRDKIYGKNK